MRTVKLETWKCRREGTKCARVGIGIEAKDVQGQGLSPSPGGKKVNRRSHKVILRQKEESARYSEKRKALFT